MIRVVSVLLATATLLAAQGPERGDREMAITVDDLPSVSAIDQSTAHAERLTKGILDAFARHRVPAVGFVNEGKLERNGETDPARVALLRQWMAAGLELGNHTYSHLDLHVVPLSEFTADLVRGERVTRELMGAADKRLRFFRHPFLHTGRSAEVRSGLQAVLSERGYQIAPVTIDNADYVFAAAYDRRTATGDTAQADRIFETYLEYMSRVVEYYEQQSIALLGRPMRHVLLTHANALNARAFPRWLPMLEHRGYRFISLDRALEDDAYATRRDEFFGPSGMTWLHRWAITEGKRSPFFEGEPEVPAWVQQASLPDAR